jgi:hypothetical protein
MNLWIQSLTPQKKLINPPLQLLQLTSNWPEPGRMGATSCKGVWEITRVHCSLHDGMQQGRRQCIQPGSTESDNAKGAHPVPICRDLVNACETHFVERKHLRQSLGFPNPRSHSGSHPTAGPPHHQLERRGECGHP